MRSCQLLWLPTPGIFLITVLMEAEFGAHDVAVDQASVRIVVGEAGLGSGAYGDVEERRGHRGPRHSSARIHRVGAVAGAVGDPTEAAAVGHRGSHGATAGRNPMSEPHALPFPAHF